MAEEFQPGQIVRLRSGSPDMTVEQYVTISGKPRVRCVWFSGATRQLGAFVPETLMMSRDHDRIAVPETLMPRRGSDRVSVPEARPSGGDDRVIPIRS